MKHKFYYLLVVAIFMVSCSTDETELFNSMDTAISENISRSIISEPIDSDSVSPLIMTDEMRTLNEAFNYKRRNIKTMSYSTDDPYVSMNLFAIREIPVKIAVKQVSLSGSKASRKSFKTKSAGHDIFLESLWIFLNFGII